jgi:hypothetical protein
MTRDEIVGLVLTKMDEMTPLGDSVDTILASEPIPIHDYVDRLLDESTADVLRAAPLHMCINSRRIFPRTSITLTDKGSLANEAAIFALPSPVSGDVYKATDTSLYYARIENNWVKLGSGFDKVDSETIGSTPKVYFVNAPLDYLRLGQLWCTSWATPVATVIIPHQDSFKYSIAKNEYSTTKSRPKAALSTRKGQKVIELYPYVKNDSGEYVDDVTLEYVAKRKPENGGVDERLIGAITWLCASKVLQAAGRKEAEAAMQSYVTELKLMVL